MYIRRLTKRYKNKDGQIVERTYYYKYKSIRRGNKIISVYLGKATEEEFLKQYEREIRANNI